MKQRLYLFNFLVFGLILYQGQTENLKGADQEIQKILEDYKGFGYRNLEIKRPTHDLDSHCGEYENKGYGIIKIVKEDDKLYAVFPAFKFLLEHSHYDYFRLKFTEEFPQQMNPDLNFVFGLDSKRDISELEMDIQRGTVFKKIK